MADKQPQIEPSNVTSDQNFADSIDALTAKGTAYVYFAQDGTGLDNTIVFADGFPGHSLDFLYDRLKAFDTWQDLNQGHAMIVLTYDDGRTYVQANAFVAVQLIETLKAKTTKPLTVAGVSMGGLITRYALGYMQQNNMPAQTDIFLCFDSPHNGACIPLGVQTGASFLSSESAAADASWKLLTSTAAKQMVVYHTGPWDEAGEHDLVSPEYTAFMADLNALPWPNATKLAVANGTGTGASNGATPGVHTLDWYGNACAYGDTWAAADSTDWAKYAFFYVSPVSGSEWTYVSRNALAYDGAPGGQRDSNGELAKGIEDSGYGWVDHWYDNTCFVPTVSALALDEDLYCVVNDLPPGSGPFDETMVSSANMQHATLSQEIADWLKTKL